MKVPSSEAAVRRTQLRAAIVCALVAVGVSIAAVVPAVEAGGGVDALVRLPEEEPLGRSVAEEDPDFHFVAGPARYDGLYFYAVALDPFAAGREHKLIDAPAYRYGHAGYGWAAGVLTLGEADLIPWALLLFSLVGMALAAGAAGLLAGELKLSPWLGLTVAVNPGLIYAVTSDTSEAFAAGLLGASLVAWLRGRRALGGILLIALCLTKEPFVMVPLGLGAWELASFVRARRRGGSPGPDMGRRSAWLAAGPILLTVWFVYLRARLDVWPFAEGPDNLELPLRGWIETLGLAADMSLDPAGHQLGAAALPLLIVVAAALLIGAGRALRLRSPIDPVFLGLALVIASLSWLALLFPKDMLRNVAASLYLLPFVLAPTRAGLVRRPQTYGAFSGRSRGVSRRSQSPKYLQVFRLPAALRYLRFAPQNIPNAHGRHTRLHTEPD